MKPSNFFIKRTFLSLLISSLCSASVFAQSSEENSDSAETAPVFEQIEVTAQRRATNLQETPVAITALSEKDMAEQGIRSPSDIAARVPSLQISSSGQIYLRGLGTPNINEVSDPTVATHLDGVYLARPAGVVGAGIYDAARVEVLRGPQGTLYGRNATSGSINIVSKKPEFYNSGAVTVEAGNYATLVTSGYSNVALSDTLAVRASFQTNSHDGYLESQSELHPDIDSADSKSTRLQVAWEPSEDLSILLRADYTKDNGLRSSYGEVTKVLGAPTDLETSSGIFGAHNESTYGGYSLEVNLDTDIGTLTYLGAIRQVDQVFQSEYLPFAGKQLSYNHDMTNQQELRLAGEAGKLTYIGGLFYFDETNVVDVKYQAGDVYYQFDQNPVKARSAAVYGQSTYALTDDFRLTAGLRYTKDEKSRQGVGNLLDSDLAFLLEFTENNAKGTWSKVNWKLGAELDIAKHVMSYLNVSTGYKAGGYFDGTGPNNTFDPEDITAYEIGIKSSIFDNSIILNLDGFYYDYENLQVSTYADVTNSGVLSQVTLNAGEARSYGLEAEMRGMLTDLVSFDVSAGYLNAEYTSFYLESGDQFSGLGNAVDYSGNSLARSPKFTLNLGIERDFEFESGYLTARLQTHYESDKNLDYHNFEVTEQDSFTKTDVIVTYEPADGDWSVMGYVRNIEDDRQFVSLDPNTETVAYGNVSAPRTIGVRFTQQF